MTVFATPSGQGLTLRNYRRNLRMKEQRAFANALAEAGWTMDDRDSVRAASEKVGRAASWGRNTLKRMRAELGEQAK